MAFKTVFDVSQQSDVMSLVFPLVLVIGATFVIASSRLRSQLPFGLGIFLPIAVVLGSILFAAAPMLRRHAIATDLDQKHYTVTEGPVSEYTRSTTSVNGFRPGHFIVQGQRFSIPNYVITKGFDNEGDAIEVGHVVRIMHDGDMILRVELQQ